MWCLRGRDKRRNHLCLLSVHSECKFTRPTLYSFQSCHSTGKIWIGLETHLLQFFIQKERHESSYPAEIKQERSQPKESPQIKRMTVFVLRSAYDWLSSELLAPLISKTVLLLAQRDQNFTIYLQFLGPLCGQLYCNHKSNRRPSMKK